MFSSVGYIMLNLGINFSTNAIGHIHFVKPAIFESLYNSALKTSYTWGGEFYHMKNISGWGI